MALYNSKLRILIVLLLSLIFEACNITYKVRNQHSEIDYVQHISCGKITSELMGRGNSIFTLKQRFEVDDQIAVMIDSLYITLNGRLVEYTMDFSGDAKGSITIKNKKTLEAQFKLEKGVFEGDTISINSSNYIRCGKDYYKLDPLVYSFVNNIRIKGVMILNSDEASQSTSMP